MSIPIIDISSLRVVNSQKSIDKVSNEIGSACQKYGFFLIKNHGVPKTLVNELSSLARNFFAKPDEEKLQIDMQKSGLAWKGYFALGRELTSKLPDAKEGLYFGREEAVSYQNKQRIPLTGPNQFPKDMPRFKPLLLEYLSNMEELSQVLMEAFATALLGYERKDFFRIQFRDEPTVLFRIFNYLRKNKSSEWGVGEHTDYGFLTLLYQDNAVGLQVKSLDGNWLDVEPVEDTFVVNIGDMMEFWSGGRFVATPHRVKPPLPGISRLSMPFFFDPAYDAVLDPVPADSFQSTYEKVNLAKDFKRWDGLQLSEGGQLPFKTYGDYLWNKVSQVFPDLANSLG